MPAPYLSDKIPHLIATSEMAVPVYGSDVALVLSWDIFHFCFGWILMSLSHQM